MIWYFYDSNIVFISGSSIQCHQCNSYDQVHCNDPFYYEDTPVNPDGTRQPKTDAFLKDCPADGKTYFCRKIYQNGKFF